MLLWDQVIYFYWHIQASFLLSVHNTLLSLINIQSLYFHEFHLVFFFVEFCEKFTFSHYVIFT